MRMIGTIAVTMETRRQYSAHYLETVSHAVHVSSFNESGFAKPTLARLPTVLKRRGRKERLHSYFNPELSED